MAGEPSIIPIKDYTYPKEGKRSLQYTVDLSNQAAVVDLVNIAQMGQMSQIPSIFFDNADNDFSVTMVMEGTFQRIVCPPKSQGYIRLLLPQKPRLGFSSEQPCQFKVNFLNFVVEELTIWKVSDVSGGTVTSVGLDMPVEFDVTGSPITSAGTFGVTWASELANKVFAAPNGAPGIPSFRSLVAADIPALPYAPNTLPTRQVLTASGNYNPTTGAVRQIVVRMVGGGGGGAGSGTTIPADATNGGDTIFNGIHAKGGGRAGSPSNTTAGVGGTGGTGVASFRTPGGGGGAGSTSSAIGFIAGGAGGCSLLGGGGTSSNNAAGVAAAANSGGGGGGAGTGNVNASGSGGGGGSGEYVELIINNPIGPITYTIGAGGGAGSAGASGLAGSVGGSGVIIVDEYY